MLRGQRGALQVLRSTAVQHECQLIVRHARTAALRRYFTVLASAKSADEVERSSKKLSFLAEQGAPSFLVFRASEATLIVVLFVLLPFEVVISATSRTLHMSKTGNVGSQTAHASCRVSDALSIGFLPLLSECRRRVVRHGHIDKVFRYVYSLQLTNVECIVAVLARLGAGWSPQGRRHATLLCTTEQSRSLLDGLSGTLLIVTCPVL